MAYQKNTWETGDTITAEKLNHMEDGIAGAGGGDSSNVFVRNNEGALDKTWQQIADAIMSEAMCYLVEGNITDRFGLSVLGYVTNIMGDGESYSVTTYSFWDSETIVYVATSADDYPIEDEEQQG